MQQAFDLIERLNKHGWILADFETEVYAALDSLKAALEQPEQEQQQQAETVTWDKPSASFDEWWDSDRHDGGNPFQTDSFAYWAFEGWQAALAQRQWVGLNVAHTVIAGAVFDFMGYLTFRKERIVLSAADEASPAVDAISDFATKRGLSLDNARVRDWVDALAQPVQEPKKRCCDHDSDCAIHNGDALPVGPCDCSQTFISSPDLGIVVTVSYQLAVRELAKLVENNFGQMPRNDEWADKVLLVRDTFEAAHNIKEQL